MGYYTSFYGSMSFNKPLDEKMAKFIRSFAESRHVKRDADKIITELKDNNIEPKHILPPVPGIENFGTNGKFFARPIYLSDKHIIPDDYMDPSVIDYNRPPDDCPGLWCDINISEDNSELTLVDGKNYEYVKWLEWLIKYFFEPAGYILNGNIEFQGEEHSDSGTITANDNHISVEFDEEY